MKTHVVTPFGVSSDRLRTIVLVLLTLIIWLASALATIQAGNNKQRKVSDLGIISTI